ncbi:MAG: DUF58 domain-containing protein [Thermodesulforhabdaceae bacterium]
MLASMLVSGVSSRHNLQDLTVKLVFPSEIFAEKPFIAIVEVTNRRRWVPAFFIKVDVMGTTSTIMFIRPGESRCTFLQLSFTRRGLYQKIPVCLMSHFPFSFFSRSVLVESIEEIVVYPALIECSDMTISGVENLKEEHSSETRNSLFGWIEEEIISIRDYQNGDPRKLINWKATAKTGILKVNERAPDQPKMFMIDLSDVSREKFEYALSCAAYLTIQLINRGYLVGLKGLNVLIPPNIGMAHLRKILGVLALYAIDEVSA